MVDFVRLMLKKGQSAEHIWSNHVEKLPISLKAFYNYVEMEVFDSIVHLTLPKKVVFKVRKRKATPVHGILGTLRRHPEIRWRLTEERIGDAAALGLALLRSAAGHVARGGQLAYATCTVAHAENNGVVKRFLESPEGADFALAPVAGRSCIATRLAPGTSDAHFAVRFVRAK